MCKDFFSRPYIDGLGRTRQTVQVGATPSGKDLVVPVQYDAIGREAQKFLAYPGANSNGAYVSTDLAEQASYFTGLYGSTDGTKAFAETEFNDSPLNKVMTQGAAGYTWQPSQHPLKYAYGSNASNEVKKWTVVNGVLTDGGYYAAATLHKTTTWDENTTKSSTTSRTEEFKDVLGRVVMKVSWNGSTPSRTAYVYDDRGLLCFVLAPDAMADNSVSSTELSEYCYQYKYDNRKRMKEKKLPGAGWEYLIYDKKDRLVLSQDAKLRAVSSTRYHYMLYDNLNRPVEAGLCTESTAYDTLRTNVSNSSNYTPASRTPEVYTYYDNYTVPSTWGYSYASIYTDQTQTNNVKGLVTGVKTKVLNTGAWLYTVNYYDKYGRLLQQYQRNPEGGYNRVSTAYNFTGDPVKRQTYHRKTSSSTAITINEEYGYDHMRRPTYVKYGYNTTSLTTVAQFTYDELGRMSKKELHNGYQDIDYAYNIRGWMTQINNPTATVSNSKLFAMQLYYETDMTTTLGGGVQYNGNISGAMWRLSSNSKKGYGFTYDGLNRLTIADYGTYSGSWANTSAYDLSSVGYDKNGNITSLTRKNSGGSNRESLTYTYLNSNVSNKLSSVSGTYNGISASGSFSYDANGNMTSDGLRGLTVTYFDELNLPKQYYKNSTNKVDYTYDAGGIKWSKTATVSGTASTTLYDGTFIYENGSLKKVLTSEGYYDPSAGRYYYYLKDHLGNTRLTFHYSGTTAVVDQEVEYYPFGSLFTENNLDKNKYLYNGKELNDEFFENYDYGARFYDPELGRWHVIDPMIEKHYANTPYAYVYNNPVSLLDPFGLDSTYYSESGKQLYQTSGDGGQSDNRYVTRTTKTTDELYPGVDDSNPQKGNSNPISGKDARATNKAIKSGNIQGAHMKNVIEIPSGQTGQDMTNVILDNGRGGESASNNTEYGGNIDANGKVVNVQRGSVGNPAQPQANGAGAQIGAVDFHSHPSGTRSVKTPNGGTGTASYIQAPSKQDIRSARGQETVIGMGSKTVYIYNNTGVVATFPLKKWGK